jgi:hypothetical protein
MHKLSNAARKSSSVWLTRLRMQSAWVVAKMHNMRAALLLIFLMVSVMMAVESHESAKQEKEQRRYNAPNGGLTARVTPISKEAGRSEYESRIEFKSADGKISCAIDYSSADKSQAWLLAYRSTPTPV